MTQWDRQTIEACTVSTHPRHKVGIIGNNVQGVCASAAMNLVVAQCVEDQGVDARGLCVIDGLGHPAGVAGVGRYDVLDCLYPGPRYPLLYGSGARAGQGGHRPVGRAGVAVPLAGCEGGDLTMPCHGALQPSVGVILAAVCETGML